MEPNPRRFRSGALGRKSQAQPPADQQRRPSASGRSRAARDTGDARARERTQTPAGTKQAQPKKPAAPHAGARPAAVKTKSSGSAVPEDSISRDVRLLIKESLKQTQAGVGTAKESLRATLMRLAGVCPNILPLPHFPRKLPDALVLATREDRANGELFYATYVAQLSGKELEAMGQYVCSTHELAVYRLFQRYIDYIVDEGWIHAEAPTPFHWCRMGSCHEYFPTRSAASAHLLSCHGSWLRTTKDAAAREDEGVKTLIKTSVNLQRQTDAALAAVATQSAAVRAECERALLEDPPPECVLITPAIAARLAQPAHVFRHAGPPPPQLPRAGDSRFYASGSAPAPPFSPSTTVEDEEQAAESRRRDDREALHRETAIRDEAQRAAEARMAARLAEVEAAAERDRQAAERDRQAAERDRQAAERDCQAAEQRIAALQAEYVRQREADLEEYRRAMAAHLDQQAAQVRQAAAATAEAERLRMQALADAEASAAQQQRAQQQQTYQAQTTRAEKAQLRQELEAMRQHMQAQQSQQVAVTAARESPRALPRRPAPPSIDEALQLQRCRHAPVTLFPEWSTQLRERVRRADAACGDAAPHLALAEGAPIMDEACLVAQQAASELAIALYRRLKGYRAATSALLRAYMVAVARVARCDALSVRAAILVAPEVCECLWLCPELGCTAFGTDQDDLAAHFRAAHSAVVDTHLITRVANSVALVEEARDAMRVARLRRERSASLHSELPLPVPLSAAELCAAGLQQD